MRKREIIISIDDNCNEPFEDVDIKHWNNVVSEMLENYDIEITKIEVRDKKEDAT
jgi:hypothetical protein